MIDAGSNTNCKPINLLQFAQMSSIYLKNTFGFVGIVACLFNVVWLAAICLGTLAIALAYFVYRYGDLVKILHGLERKDILKYTGSQYSFKDP